MVEAVWTGGCSDQSNQRPEKSPPPLPDRLQAIARVDRALSLVSPSVARRTKTQRGVTEVPQVSLVEGCGGELPALCSPASAPVAMTKKHNKRSRDRATDKIYNLSIHLHALFAAVEHGHIDKVKTILESTDVDVNSVNTDGLTPLDVAVLSNNRQLAKTLMGFGGREGNQFKSPESLGAHLRRLSRDADARLRDAIGGASHIGPGGGFAGDSQDTHRDSDDIASGCTRAGAAAAAAGTTGCAGGAAAEKQRQAAHCERRARALRRMSLGWQQTKSPSASAPPTLAVVSPHAVSVTLAPPANAGSPTSQQTIITKYKVQWSSRSDFSVMCGSREVWANGGIPASGCSSGGAKALASGLTRGRRYYFRAQAGNLKGWGPFTNSHPPCVVPGVWRDVDGRSPRYDSGRTCAALDALRNGARLTRGGITSSSSSGASGNTGEEDKEEENVLPAQAPARPPAKRKTATIRQLFTAASKFQKNLRRGVYLACILYHEDKVLVTNEEFLPVIEVDDTYPHCVYADYNWLMKVSCTWDEVKSLRNELEKHTSSSMHFRTKLLAAVSQMQSALCIQDLGQLAARPLRDRHGTLVMCCVNAAKSARGAATLNSRWVPLDRARRRPPPTTSTNELTAADLLMASIHDHIAYHQASQVRLPRGLYVGYLKLQSSMEVVQVVVPARTPNAPPHIRVRDNPHVSAEEWEHLKSQQGEERLPTSRRPSIASLQQMQQPSESQQIFLEQLTVAIHKLFKFMDISLDNALTHRLYDLEVIDLSVDVSFVMLCPPPELACSVPGQKEMLLQRGDLLSLPIQAFEMIHLSTYHSEIVNKYCRLSCVLELDVTLAAHLQREAFSSTELQVAKDKLIKLEDLQNGLNAIWKSTRWLMDVIAFARGKDKTSNASGTTNPGVLMKHLIVNSTDSIPSGEIKQQELNCSLLQLPPREPIIMKTSPGRGSWPGPAGGSNANGNLLNTELSKSEQHLSITPRDDSISTLNLTGSQYLNANSDSYSRKGSADSQYTQSSISSNYVSDKLNFSNAMVSLSASNRIPPSKSEDTLLISQPEIVHSRRRVNVANASLSATSSPLLHVKPFFAGSMVSMNTIGNTDSTLSLSSDSESQSCPISTSTPTKIRYRPKHHSKRDPSNLAPSKSMTSVKSGVDFTDTGQNNLFLKPTTYLKPTLNAIHSESEFNIGDAASKDDYQFFSCEDDDVCKKEKDENIGHAAPNEEPTSIDRGQVKTDSDQPGILQVFAAYETGLAAGTSLKLHVTPRTCARDVVNLVVNQLNMAAVLKGKSGPVYGPENLSDFCLVAVIGARERRLRDDFRPLQLQNPWRRGRLYVRMRHDVLAALQHATNSPAYV